jgi:hypothetical protein
MINDVMFRPSSYELVVRGNSQIEATFFQISKISKFFKLDPQTLQYRS